MNQDHCSRRPRAVAERLTEADGGRGKKFPLTKHKVRTIFFSYTIPSTDYGHHGCRYCGFFADSPGRTDPSGTQAGSSARVVEQEHRRRGGNSDNNCTDRRSGAFERTL